MSKEKEVDSSFDEAWDDVELNEDETQTDAKTDETVEDKTEEKEVEETTVAEETDKTVAEEEVEEDTEEDTEEEKPKSKVDWKALGFDKFEGKTDDEVVEQLKFERQQLGHTVNMLGELRREIAELKKPKKVEKEEKPKDVLASIPELDDADAAKFNAMYEKNPIKAIMTYGGSSIKDLIANEVNKALPKESVQDVKAEIAYSTFINTVKPSELEVEQMKIFDKPEYLGAQARSYSDLHGLSKMWLDDSEESKDVYGLMKKHPTMSFDEACGIVRKPKTKTPIDKEKIKQTINKNKQAESHPKKKAQALPSSDLSFDEAFDSA